MFNYNSPGAIAIYVFIGIGIIAICVALFYTKVIKKNQFAYCNKSILTIRKIVRCLNFGTSDPNKIIIKDLFLNLNNEKDNSLVFYYLSAVLITERFVVILTYELNKQGFKVNNQADKITVYTKSHRELVLPIEIQTVLDGRRPTVQLAAPLPLYILIPWDNKTSEPVANSRPNTYVVPTHKLTNFIQTLHDKLPIIADVDLLKIKKSFISKNYQKRMRLPFLNWNIKDTVWDKK